MQQWRIHTSQPWRVPCGVGPSSPAVFSATMQPSAHACCVLCAETQASLIGLAIDCSPWTKVKSSWIYSWYIVMLAWFQILRSCKVVRNQGLKRLQTVNHVWYWHVDVVKHFHVCPSQLSFYVVGMLQFMFLTETNRACPLLFILFLCLCPSLCLFQLYFIS